eukprot:TRINITY_DN13941_c0_g1_i1.p1 TRINITY_DN13941_c0_g1~~TRINITY_DN13941_c0_g1_i1.p1  ORF type:complete len:201 (+),score=79.25 TRINITY_DN13941_c0_g1_i1:73-675(+)
MMQRTLAAAALATALLPLGALAGRLSEEPADSVPAELPPKGVLLESSAAATAAEAGEAETAQAEARPEPAVPLKATVSSALQTDEAEGADGAAKSLSERAKAMAFENRRVLEQLQADMDSQSQEAAESDMAVAARNKRVMELLKADMDAGTEEVAEEGEEEGEELQGSRAQEASSAEDFKEELEGLIGDVNSVMADVNVG